MSVLPAYEARAEVQVSDLKQVLENTRIEDPEKAVDELYKELGSVDVGPIIKALGNDIVSIKDDFDSIYSTLGLLDEQGYKKKSVDGSSDDDPIPKFQPEWGKIRKNFEEQIWESKKIATEGAARANSYRTVMVPMIKDDGVPIEAKKAELDHFIKEIEATTNSAQRMAESFLELPTRIKDFRVRLSKALVQVGLNFTGKIQQLKQDVDALSAKLEKQTRMSGTARHWARRGLHTAETGVALLIAFGTLLGPVGLGIFLGVAIVGAVAAVGGQLSLFVLDSKRGETDRVLASKSQDLEKIQKDFQEFEAINSQIQLALARTSGLCQRLAAIGEVWTAIRADAQSIRDTISQGRNCPTEYGCKLYLRENQISGPYEKLEHALEAYASQVNKFTDDSSI
ncbi:Serine/threonine-protein kinase [Ceratobasidium sp. AG-Ba]|nr:Serine/threonine-protein kinase [Ceratobasidium sp. AG-Ba]QRW08638.1 Serine/threonine-protein kinase [Ceratobasidium sp. AG-Ba]